MDNDTELDQEQRPNNKIKVFIADDSAIIRQRVVTLISELGGFKILGLAGTGAETIGGVRDLKPDVLILDIRMPGGNGFEVLQDLKQRQERPLIIVLTNHPTYRQQCLQAGADFFLDKSAEFEQVPVLLEQLRTESLKSEQLKGDGYPGSKMNHQGS